MKKIKKNILDVIKKTHALITIEEGKLLYDLAKNGPGKGTIVEIGSYKGGSTILLAMGSKISSREKVYAIDPHKKYNSHAKKIGKEKVPPSTLEIFKQNVSQQGVKDWIVPIVGFSEKIVRKWKQPIRLLWIDGDHRYEYVLADFLLWERYLVKGGIIAFHDTKDSKKINPITGKAISSCDGPVIVMKDLIESQRYGNIKTVDSISFATKIKQASGSEILQNNVRIRLIKNKALYTKLTDMDYIIGGIGKFIKKLNLKLYYTIKKLINKKREIN